MKLKEDYLVREIAGEYMAIPVGENAAEFKGIIVLNEVSAFILEHMKKPTDKKTLLDLMLGEFDVTFEEASKDLDELLKTLTDYGMIE